MRKLKLSLLAMLCGWIACNIAWWAGAIPSMDATAIQHLFSIRSNFFALSMVGTYTAIVVFLNWLVIFLPVDLILPDESKLRRPKTAALCGFLSAFSIVIGTFVYAAYHNVMRLGLADGITASLNLVALPFALGTCATGTVAAYVRTLMDKPQVPASP